MNLFIDCAVIFLSINLRIFMHRMHSIKNLRCLVGILENTKCISDQRRKEAI